MAAARSPVVMKFGGTSVEDGVALERMAAIVVDRGPEQPVVVVSAMAQVTDGLVALARLALENRPGESDAIIAGLRQRHLDALEQLGGDAEAAAAIQRLVAELAELMRGVAAVGELTDRTRDAVLGYGERLSPWVARAALL
ncbi:MAG: lysine-sensitive aspartokinase 3, partial [Terriglobales bacterium]